MARSDHHDYCIGLFSHRVLFAAFCLILIASSPASAQETLGNLKIELTIRQKNAEIGFPDGAIPESRRGSLQYPERLKLPTRLATVQNLNNKGLIRLVFSPGIQIRVIRVNNAAAVEEHLIPHLDIDLDANQFLALKELVQAGSNEVLGPLDLDKTLQEQIRRRQELGAQMTRTQPREVQRLYKLRYLALSVDFEDLGPSPLPAPHFSTNVHAIRNQNGDLSSNFISFRGLEYFKRYELENEKIQELITRTSEILDHRYNQLMDMARRDGLAQFFQRNETDSPAPDPGFRERYLTRDMKLSTRIAYGRIGVSDNIKGDVILSTPNNFKARPISVSTSRRYVALAFDDNMVFVYIRNTGELVRSIQMPSGPLKSVFFYANSLALEGENNRFVFDAITLRYLFSQSVGHSTECSRLLVLELQEAAASPVSATE